MSEIQNYNPDLDNNLEINENDLEKLQEILGEQKKELFELLVSDFKKSGNKEHLEKIKKLIEIGLKKNNNDELKKFYDEVFGEISEIKESYKDLEGYDKLPQEIKNIFDQNFEKYGEKIIPFFKMIFLSLNQKYNLEKKSSEDIQKIKEELLKIFGEFQIIGKTKEEFEKNLNKLEKFYGHEHIGRDAIVDLLKKIPKYEDQNFLEKFLKILEKDEKIKYLDLDNFLSTNREYSIFDDKFLDFLEKNKDFIKVFDTINSDIPRHYIYELANRKFPLQEFKDFRESKNIFTKEKIYALVVCFNNGLSVEKIKYYFSLFPNNEKFFKEFNNYSFDLLKEIDKKIWENKDKKWKFKDFNKVKDGEEKEMNFEELIQFGYNFNQIYSAINAEEFVEKQNNNVIEYRAKVGDLIKDFSDADIQTWLIHNTIPPENIKIFEGIDKKFTAKDLAFLGQNHNWKNIELGKRKEIVQKFLGIDPNFTGDDITYLQYGGLGFGYKNKLNLSEKDLTKSMKSYTSKFPKITGEELESFILHVNKNYNGKIEEKFQKYQILLPGINNKTLSVFYQIEKHFGEKRLQEIVRDFKELDGLFSDKTILEKRLNYKISDELFEKIKNNKLEINEIFIFLARGLNKNIIFTTFIDALNKGALKEGIYNILSKKITSGDRIFFEDKKILKNFQKEEIGNVEHIDYDTLFLARDNGISNETLLSIFENYLEKTYYSEKYKSDLNDNLLELFEFGGNGKLESFIKYLDTNKNETLNINSEKVKIFGNRQFLLGILMYVYDIYGKDSKNINWKKMIKEYETQINNYLKQGKNISQIFTLGGNFYFGEDEKPFVAKSVSSIEYIFGHDKINDYSTGTKLNNFEKTSEFLDELEKYLKSKENSGEKIFVYISTHGGVNGDTQFINGGLGKEDFTRLEKIISGNKNINVMINSCHSGAKFDLSNMKGNIFINSGKNLSSANSFTGGNELNNLVFNRTLGDFDKNGEITAEELEIYMMIYYQNSPIINNGFREFYKNKGENLNNFSITNNGK